MAAIRVTVPRDQIQQVMGPTYKELVETLAGQGIEASGPWLTHHFRMDPEVFDFEICVPVAEPIEPTGRVQPSELPAARVARTVYHGAYEGLEQAWGEFDAWIESQELEPDDSLWEVYRIGPDAGDDPAAFRTELNRPLR